MGAETFGRLEWGLKLSTALFCCLMESRGGKEFVPSILFRIQIDFLGDTLPF